jgi:hypothetical protein
MTRTLRDMAKEVTSHGYFGRARQRAQRRKSVWNLLLIPLVFGFVVATTYVLFRVMWEVHTAIYPSHVGRLAEFWGKNISLGSFVSSLLLLLPLFFASLPIGMILANLIAWLIPSARRIFDREAEGVAGASFTEAISGLWKVALVLVPICLVLSSIGAATLRDLH